MISAFTHLNFPAVFSTALLGFLIGWFWYSPALFARAWMAGMQLTEEKIKALDDRAKARIFAMGVAYTLISTFALATLMASHHVMGGLRGAEMGAFVGALIVGTRVLNDSLWERRSLRMQAIIVGHETALFTVQGAILGVWH